MIRRLLRLCFPPNPSLSPFQEVQALGEFGKRKRMQGRHEGALMALAALDGEMRNLHFGHFQQPGLRRAVTLIEELVEETNHEVSEFRQKEEQ